MPVFRSAVTLPAPPEAVFAWHTRPGALERLVPPWSGVTVARPPGAGLVDGERFVLHIPAGPLRLPWVGVYCGVVPGREFHDVQLEGPFRAWERVQRLLPAALGTSTLETEVRFALPRGLSWSRLAERAALRRLERWFTFRHQRLRADLLRHQRFAGQALRIAVTGSGGLLGRRLVPFLRGGGHTVMRLVRGGGGRAPDAVFWDPASGALDIERLSPVDAVIHLAGENIAAGRWNAARKAAIRASRVEATRELCASLAALARPPRVFVAASAVGYYGHRPDEPVNEDSPPGRGFLAEVCQEWEAATAPLHGAGTRIAALRLGVVIAAEGGALPRMLLPFRLGLGGRLGSGRQALPWIAAEDAIGVIHQALFDERLRGPVNAVAPQAVTNREFTRTLASVLRRPALFPIPAALLRAALGEMGQALLLEGAVVLPTRLRQAGFEHLFPDLEGALRAELGRFSSD
jgi:hypothetical protein